MNRLAAALAAALLSLAGLVAAQAVPKAGEAKQSTPAGAPAKGQKDEKPKRYADYEAPFADYRPFTADPPAKPWRAANDAVREAGGHIGVLKALEAAKRKDAKP